MARLRPMKIGRAADIQHRGELDKRAEVHDGGLLVCETVLVHVLNGKSDDCLAWRGKVLIPPLQARKGVSGGSNNVECGRGQDHFPSLYA